MGGSYDTGIGTISVDLGAHLHLWGPEFAGNAELDLYVATVHVSFGDQNPKGSPYIRWPKFKEAFLPEDGAVVSLALENGLVEAGDAKAHRLGTINPRELRIVTNSLVPATQIKTGANTEPDVGKVRVAPVDVPDCTSTHTVTIVKITLVGETESEDDVTGEFRFERVSKRLPAALWGAPNGGKPPVNTGDKFVAGVTGVRLSPRKPPTAHASKAVETRFLRWDAHRSTVVPSQTFCQFWRHARESTAPRNANRETIGITISQPEVVAARNRHFVALGLDPATVRVGGLSGRMLGAEPRLGFVSEPTA